MKTKSKRREFLKQSAIVALAGASLRVGGWDLMGAPADEAFTLPLLPYPYEALEPHIDKQTMQIHHDKHHQAYVDNLNKAVKEGGLGKISLQNMLEGASKLSPAVRNNGGGHYNHSLFWTLMTPSGGGEPTGPIADAINASFGTYASFREKFNAAATSRFGSGWAWLVAKGGKLEIGSTPNQDNPLMDVSDLKGTPILALDVWEHAYYLKYQNKRVDYVNAWWNLVNWGEASRLLKAVK